MDTKLFARIGAGAFVAVALTMTALQLREERKVPLPEVVTVAEPEGDPLAATLRDCGARGEQALESPVCRAAWAEKRRRFLGTAGKPGGAVAATEKASEAPEPAEPFSFESQPAKDH
ncbi:putative entry exclusion protein TrbK-alt [Novosphingobium sp.]|uniref:putative entry exclusion protein TrbK-alt n=1 Tax=Novosphingobium sp. TaxID=1874826 RepID=UPI00262DE834|nr:putative entry exclusion protein TrbK-alt [Novosphingobium sp.]